MTHLALGKVTDVSYQYAGADSPALCNINLNIAEGCCFGLLGPNGAGKTTLISLLTGGLRPQSGTITVGGLDASENSGAIKAMSALTPQEYAFYPNLTGRENLAFFADMYRLPKGEKARQFDFAVAACALEAYLDRRAASYSGGLKRRLNIAISLLRKPRLLYLDEPTVGIDAQSRHFILQTIRQLRAEGMTIVYSSHYMEEVEQLCDQLAIIHQGKVVLQSDMPSLLAEDTVLEIQPRQPLQAEQLAQLGEGWQWQQRGEILSLQPGSQPLSTIFANLERQGVDIARFNLGRSRLESIYLRITGAAATHSGGEQR
jgi:ABC-2 type transport system ATP-binding protein